MVDKNLTFVTSNNGSLRPHPCHSSVGFAVRRIQVARSGRLLEEFRPRRRQPNLGSNRRRRNLKELNITIAEPPGGTSRAWLTVQLLTIIALSAAVFPAMTPGHVVAGSVITKLLFLGRMGLLLMVAAIFLHLRGLGWADLGLRRPVAWRLAISVVGGLVASVAMVAVVRRVLVHLGGAAPDYAMFEPLKGDLPEYLYWALPVTLGSAALGEELLFRGFVRDALQRLFRSNSVLASFGAVALQAMVFGLVHLYQGWGGVASAATIGLVLGAVWLVSGHNLWAGIITHGVLDLTSLTVIYVAGVPKAN